MIVDRIVAKISTTKELALGTTDSNPSGTGKKRYTK
jgi:hypothetical protein